MNKSTNEQLDYPHSEIERLTADVVRLSERTHQLDPNWAGLPAPKLPMIGEHIWPGSESRWPKWMSR